jgi:hypothetical protein
MKKNILLSILSTCYLAGISCSCLPDQPTGFYENLTSSSSTCIVVLDSIEYKDDPNEPQIGYFKIITAINNMGEYSDGDSIIVFGGASHLCQSSLNFAKNDTLVFSLNSLSYGPQMNNCETSHLLIQNGMHNGEDIEDIIGKVNLKTVGTNRSIQKHTIQVFPNPVNDNMRLETSSSTFSAIEITGITGAVLYKEKFSSTANKTINLNTLPTGFYSVKLNSSEGIVHKRIIKK